ncbi:hypothetical protein Y032_0052g2272 [Ancylostoma ceylanicum]|uniref:Uncharacterized protein n=1 Tax=Ancylostoma ceylanicum TaxID=53326 RepID=A0A016U998_9BILA|nr:hypothetical protein Y032_0052g2272 [Ancylostoma ceylanicum]
MSRIRDPAEYVSKATHRWAFHAKRQQMDKKNTGMDLKRNETTPRKTINEIGQCVYCTKGPAESSAGNKSELSSTLSTMLLDDRCRRTNGVRAMMGAVRQVTMRHPSI